MSYQNTTAAVNTYTANTGTSSTNPFIDVFETRDPTTSDVNYTIQKKWLNTSNGNYWELVSVTTVAGVMSAIWIPIAGSTGEVNTLSDDVGTIVTPQSNNIQLVGHVNEQGSTKFSTVVAGSHLLNLNPMSVARWIVDPLGFNGTHTTITAAIASATAGDTVFIMDGTYAESPTLKAGVNLTAFGSSGQEFQGTPNVIISGTVTASFSGSITISGIEFQTSGSNPALTFTGSNPAFVECIECQFDPATNCYRWFYNRWWPLSKHWWINSSIYYKRRYSQY
jgi:hypothetical protein